MQNNKTTKLYLYSLTLCEFAFLALRVVCPCAIVSHANTGSQFVCMAIFSQSSNVSPFSCSRSLCTLSSISRTDMHRLYMEFIFNYLSFLYMYAGHESLQEHCCCFLIDFSCTRKILLHMTQLLLSFCLFCNPVFYLDAPKSDY